MQHLWKTIKPDIGSEDALAVSGRLRELQRVQMIFTDQQMAESMSAATLQDAEAIAALGLEEEAAGRDRSLAMSLETGRVPLFQPVSRLSTINPTAVEESILSQLAA